MKFTVWNTQINVCVAEYEAEAPRATFEIDPAYNGAHFETRDANNAVVPATSIQTRWATFDFLRRFGPDERIAARTLAKTDPIVEDFMDLLGKSTNIVSSDPDTQAGMDYLVYVGVLTEARKNTILGA